MEIEYCAQKEGMKFQHKRSYINTFIAKVFMILTIFYGFFWLKRLRVLGHYE